MRQQKSFPTWPFFEQDEITAVCKVLASGKVNYWTGNQGRDFEIAFAKFMGVQYGIALANGTLSLELALRAIGIKKGDEIIIPCRTFIATAGSIVAVGGIPVVADVDYRSQNITANTIATVLTAKTKAIIVVHLAGWPCDMDPIMDLAMKHNLVVIEDCAQAHGAQYKDRFVGTIGHAGVFSFCQDKIMTTGGEGGLLITNDAQIWQRAWMYKEHGKDCTELFMQENEVGFKWLHNTFGSNFRMTEMQAAIGLLQLKKLSQWLSLRQRNARRLHVRMQAIQGIESFIPPKNFKHAYYKFYATIIPEYLKANWNRDKILYALQTMGIPCNVGSCPEINRELAFKKFNNNQLLLKLPIAQKLGKTSLMFQVHPILQEQHMDMVADSIASVLQDAVK